MSKMCEELDRRLDENKYEMYETLKDIIAEGTRCIEAVRPPETTRNMYNINGVDKIARRVIARIEREE